MRKISIDAAKAFKEAKPFKRDNTEVIVENKISVEMYLFGNLIAKHYENEDYIEISDGGYEGGLSRTTIDRLKAIIDMCKPIEGVEIWTRFPHKHKDTNYLNGQPWDGRWIQINK